MTDFDDREKAFEKKFEHDEEMSFKIASRTARLFGLWIAEQLGLKGDEAEAYAAHAAESTAVKSGHEELFKKVEKDLQAKGIQLSRHRLEKEMGTFYQTARQQVAE